LQTARGGLEPAYRVLFSASFHGFSLGNFHQGSNLWKGARGGEKIRQIRRFAESDEELARFYRESA
jgi:hypothetical protein